MVFDAVNYECIGFHPVPAYWAVGAYRKAL